MGRPHAPGRRDDDGGTHLGAAMLAGRAPRRPAKSAGGPIRGGGARPHRLASRDHHRPGGRRAGLRARRRGALLPKPSTVRAAAVSSRGDSVRTARAGDSPVGGVRRTDAGGPRCPRGIGPATPEHTGEAAHLDRDPDSSTPRQALQAHGRRPRRRRTIGGRNRRTPAVPTLRPPAAPPTAAAHGPCGESALDRLRVGASRRHRAGPGGRRRVSHGRRAMGRRPQARPCDHHAASGSSSGARRSSSDTRWRTWPATCWPSESPAPPDRLGRVPEAAPGRGLRHTTRSNRTPGRQDSSTTTAEAMPASWESERWTEAAPSSAARAATVPRSSSRGRPDDSETTSASCHSRLPGAPSALASASLAAKRAASEASGRVASAR